MLSNIAKVTEGLIEQKELKIKDTNARKDTFLANVFDEIEILKSKLDK